LIEVTGDLWTYPADIRVITTNGSVNSKGLAVMGRGCAKDAAIRWPESAEVLAKKIRDQGNHVHILGLPDPVENFWLVSFPVKHHWNQLADPKLIARSCAELVNVVNALEQDRWADSHHQEHDHLEVVLPRPGCGFGGLRWEVVRVICDFYLDDRFRVITWQD
jgi:hypothetical protein